MSLYVHLFDSLYSCLLNWSNFVILPSITLSFWFPSSSVWSNFEIADMDFWRSEAYAKFFEFLDSKGGFYYEVNIAPTILSFPLSANIKLVAFPSALGRCPSPFHCCCSFPAKGSAAFLQRHRLPSRTIPALSKRRRLGEGKVYV